MRHPQGTVFVIPLRPRKLLLPGVLVAGLLALLLCQPGSSAARYAPVPADPPAELRLIPPDAFVVLHVNVAALLNKDLVQAGLPLLGDKAEARHTFGAPLAQIDSLAFLGGERWSLHVITTRKDLDPDKVREAVAARSVEQTYKGKKFYADDVKFRSRDKGFKDDAIPRDKRIKKEGFQADEREQGNVAPWAASVYFLTDRTYVVGDARGVMHFIDKAEKPGEKHPLQDVCSRAGRHHVTLGFHIPEEMTREAEQSISRMARFDVFTAMLLYNFKPLASTRHGLFTADLGEEARLDGTLEFPNARTAEQAQDAIRVSLMLARGGLLMIEDQVRENSDPKAESTIGKLMDPLRLALNEAAIKTDGSTVKVSVKATLDDKLVKAVVAEAAPRMHLAANRATAMNNLKRLALCLIKTADDNEGPMPSSIVYSKDGKPLYSWRVLMLPNLGEGDLYRKLKLDEPWDSKHNKPLLSKMPKAFALPGVKAPENMTFFQIFEGAGTLSAPNRMARYPVSFTDGTSNTILIVEAAEPVHWAAPGDIAYSARVSPLKQIGRHYAKSGLCVTADGAVHSLSAKLSEETLRAAITPAGNEVLGSDWDDEIDKDKGPRRDFGKDKKPK